MMSLQTYPLVLSEQSRRLVRENQTFKNTGGVSQQNRELGFIPAFLDFETGAVYISCYANGQPATIHVYDGLPDTLVTQRGRNNLATQVKRSVVSGFMLGQRFYTREQVASLVENLEKGKQILPA